MSNLTEQLEALSPKKRELFQLLLEKKQNAAAKQAITRRAHNGSIPLSFAQQRLWFLDQWQPGTSLYNLPGGLRLIGALDIPALERSLNEILRRHEALRTTFPTVDGQPAQRVAAAERFLLPAIDLRSLPADEREVEVRRLAQEEYEQPFDLVEGPLFRAKLLQVSDEEHVLAMTMHHIVSDGWSSGLFAQELSALYKSFVEQHPYPLPELPIQYSDFAQWQHEWLKGEVLEKQLAYWKKQLEGAPEVLSLPIDHQRSAMQTFQGTREQLLLSEQLTEALRTLSRQNDVTLFMTLLAAFQVLLSRYSGQTDVVVGSPVAGRNRPETEGLIGLFVNTLAFRCDLSGDPSFIQLLSRVREMTLSAYSHQDLPFEKLVEELHPARDLSRPPIFQVMFVLQNVEARALELPGLRIRAIESDTNSAKFDLSLYLWDSPARLEGQIEYNTDLFELSTIRGMITHLTTLLENAVADPTRPLSRISMVTEPEREQVLFGWNQTAATYPSDCCIQQLFEQQVEKTPEAIALVFEEQQLTYRELNEQANRVAHRLRSLGVGPDVLVGLCLERGITMVVGLMGILKAGGAYVPLDPAYPQERLSLMLDDAAIEVLLTETRLMAGLPSSHSTHILCLDEDFESEPGANPAAPTSNQLAYVIYTSGSTGKPKGVMVEHKQLVNFISSMQELTRINPRDTLLAVTTLGFDIAGLEMFLPLTVGARLVVASREAVLDGRVLIDLMKREAVTVLQATPVTWRMLIDTGWQGSDRLLALCGGEPLSRELANQLVARAREVWNMYGPTETTIWSTATRVEEGSGPVFIGGPIANTQIFILDENTQPAPVGVPGELYIGGDGVARGYLNRDELTSERFVANPFNKEPGARIYRTGDAARYLASGEIEFFGRLDSQVKVRGHRVEPGEIEAVLKECPGIKEAVVIAKDDGPEKRLVAYLISTEDVSSDGLRPQLLRQLPDYMVPSVFVKLERLPLTPNGKIDRKALPSPSADRPQLKATYVAPRSELEQNLASVWQRALRLETVGRDDTFFDLGGHSLLMAQVRNTLSQELSIDVSIVDLFKYPTIGTLAEFLAKPEVSNEVQPIQHRAGARLESMRTNMRQRQMR
jgi:amino acid adenylation domain-containing protein